MKLKTSSSTVAARLSRLIVGFMLVMVVTGVISYLTLSRFKVNGPVYIEIAQQKDLLGDILPPPMYVLETYMTALQMLGGIGFSRPAGGSGKAPITEKGFY